MPVYNGEKYLHEAIESILAQSFSDWEFLIINEYSSNQETTDILMQYEKQDKRIRIIQNQERLRIAESLNVGLRAAQGEYIARMDADDIAGKDRFAFQVAYMDRHPDIDICGLKVDMFGENTWDWKVFSNPEYLHCACLFYTPFVHPTVMMRAASLQRYRLEYNKDFFYTEDYEFFERASCVLKYTNIELSGAYFYRYLSTNATNVGGNKGLQLQNDVMTTAMGRWGLHFTKEEIRILSPNTYPYAHSVDEAQDLLVQLDLLLKEILLCDALREAFGIDILFQVLHRRWMDAYEALRWRTEIMEDGQVQRAVERGLFYRKKFYVAVPQAVELCPRVSVVLPTYNSESYIMDTIWSLLEQDYKNFEILVINEKDSEDRTKKEITLFHDPRVRIIQNQEKLGLANSLNLGFQIAKGEFVARADADDLYSPERFSKQVAFLDSHPEIDVCGTWQRHFGKRNYIHRPPAAKEDLRANLIFKCEVCHSTVMLRREKFLALDVIYDDEYLSEDYELWSRVSPNMWFATIPEVLGEYRWNGENITAKKLDRLDIEAQKLVQRNLKLMIGLEVPEQDLILLSGWKNPFMDKTQDQEELRRREEILLEQIEKQNEKVGSVDRKAMKQVLYERRVWSGLQKEPVFSRVSKITEQEKPKGIMKKYLKKLFKKIFRPLYRPIRVRYENRLIGIQDTVWNQEGKLDHMLQTLYDVDGHLYDYYRYLEVKIQRMNNNIEAIQKALLVAETSIVQMQSKLEQELELIQKVFPEFKVGLKENEESILLAVNKRVNDSEKLISQTMDTRIQKAEEFINQTTDTRIWNAEKLINQAIDTRICQAEKLVNQTTDTRIWNAEKLINQTTDARICQAEKLVNQTTDTRIWNAEKLINQVTDTRVWKAEETIKETIKETMESQTWNLLYELTEKDFMAHQDSAIYDFNFYLNNRYHSALSAQHILPKLFSVLPHQKVADFGCGTGTWLWVAMQIGAEKVAGYDGSYVPKNFLMIPESSFFPVDLEKEVDVEGRFDIAFCMEVAEHLKEESADVLLKTLCRSSDVLLFSAAHPGQGGDGHINEQPMEYWAGKFASHGYEQIEIRQLFQSDERIEWWYRDNITLFVKKGNLCDQIRKSVEQLETK